MKNVPCHSWRRGDRDEASYKVGEETPFLQKPSLSYMGEGLAMTLALRELVL